jgi:serine/threonine protein phosphatase PrpC
MRLIARTDIGASRTQNQDRIWSSESEQALAVLDGCGGEGRPADAVLVSITSALARRVGPLTEPELLAIYRSANAALAAAMKADESARGGTTLDLLTFGDTLLGLHIGDGRVYRVREGAIRQLSTDHRWVAERVALGELTESEAERHPRRNVITRAMVGSERDEPEILRSDIIARDIFIACTDGVWGAVSANILASQVSRPDIGMGLDELFAMSRASNDNMSIALALA